MGENEPQDKNLFAERENAKEWIARVLYSRRREIERRHPEDSYVQIPEPEGKLAEIADRLKNDLNYVPSAEERHKAEEQIRKAIDEYGNFSNQK